MRCLSCERHVLFRVVMRFTKEAIVNGTYTKPATTIEGKFAGFGYKNTKVNFQNDGNRYPAICEIVVNVEVPNMQKRTISKIAKEIKSLVDGDMFEEGFIEIYEPTDVLELLPMTEDMKACRK